MTKNEFLLTIPDIIEHPTWGHGELEIIVDTKDKKGVCYRYKDNLASGGNFAKTWVELFEKMKIYLKDYGYFQE